jgi:hypothetical protein
MLRGLARLAPPLPRRQQNLHTWLLDSRAKHTNEPYQKDGKRVPRAQRPWLIFAQPVLCAQQLRTQDIAIVYFCP